MTNEQGVQAHGNTLQDNAPLLLRVTKNGYMDYTDEITPTMKTQYQVSMNRMIPLIFTTQGKMLIDMKPADPQSLVYSEL